MSNIVLPVGSTLPATGNEMNAAAWHALVDGLQVENFGESDFIGGDARILSVSSGAPDYLRGRAWWDTTQDCAYVWGESDTSAPSEPCQMVGGRWEIVCYAESPVSLGMPVYVEGAFWRTDSSGPSGSVLPIPIPKVSARPFLEGTVWAPACGLAQDTTSGEEYIRVGFRGLMYAMCDDTTVSYGSLGYFEATEWDRITAGTAQNYGGAGGVGYPGVRIGVWADSDSGATGLRPLLFCKNISCFLEDRS